MKISKRLKEIAEYVDDNSFIIDVGCDHALLDIYLVNNKENIKVIASDINKGPLNTAHDNIKKYNLEESIILMQADGLDKMPSDVDTVVISGMGFYTIKDILNKNKKKLDNIDSMIISVNKDFYELRKYITKNNFYIVREKIIEDQHQFYLILKVVKGRKKYTKKELFYKTKTMDIKNSDYIKYVKKEIDKKKNILNKLPKNKWYLKYKLKKEIKRLNSFTLEEIL